MSSPRWQRIEQLYHSALEQDPDRRDAFLIDACADDDDLHREVDSLLACDERAEHFFATPGLKAAQAAAENRYKQSNMPAPLASGEQLGPYCIIALLGSGGMGEVYSATDTRLQRNVAIKLLSPEFSDDDQFRDRFQREARAVSALNHPHICTIHDVGEYQGRPFFVMELVEGKSLKEHISDMALPVTELVDVAVQIAEGLKVAHMKGIVHRDIKPANILLIAGLQVKILDFGLAKRTAEPRRAAALVAGVKFGNAAGDVTEATLTQPGGVMGTVAYLSPEQARGEEVDARTDIYSFGVVLYQMATGRPIFRGDTAAQFIEAILKDAPAPPSELNPAIPAGLESIILKALAKERAARYQTVEEILADFRNLEHTRVRRTGWTGRLAAAGSVLALAAALAGITSGTWPHTPGGLPNLIQRRVTANPSNDSVYTAALSGDGSQLAYADLEGVHIRILDTGEVHNIVLPAGFCFR